MSRGERLEALPPLARRNPHILVSGSVILVRTWWSSSTPIG